MPATMANSSGMTKARYLNSMRRATRRYGDEYGGLDGKRRRRTNRRRGFLSQMADGYRGT